MRTDHGPSRNPQLRDGEAVVHFTQIRNHAGSNGPGHCFVMQLARTIFLPIQALEL
jgi:hypothetical protein